MKYDAVSFVPHKPFRPEASGSEFETDAYCLSLDGAITLHLKVSYLDNLLGNTPPEQRQIRKWYFYTAHLNCLYLLLDGFVLMDLRLSYFDLEEVTTQNVDVVSETGATISARSHRTLLPPRPDQPLLILNDVLASVNHAFLSVTSEFEHVYVLSELAKSLAAYKSANFTTSLVLAWFLLERFIESLWTDYLQTENREFEDGQRRINADRRKFLNDHRSYPISVKLQILELAQKLSFGQFSELDVLRRKRNEIVHPKKAGSGNAAVQGDPESCSRAFELLQQFLKAHFDLRLTLNGSYSHLRVFERQ